GRGIPTVAILHGGAGSRLGYRFLVGDADRFLGWSNVDCRFLEADGVAIGKLRPVGRLVYDGEHREGVGRLDALRTRVGSDGTRRPVLVLLTAAVNAGMAAVVANPKAPSHLARDRGLRPASPRMVLRH